MSEFFANLAIIVVIIAWLIGIVGLFLKAIDVDSGQASWTWGVIAALFFAVPLAGVAVLSRDPYPDTLCARGHQEWVSNGKMRSKRWYCDQFDLR